MKTIFEKKYIVLPVNPDVTRKKIEFYKEGELVFDLDCNVDMINPRHFHYADVSHLVGSEIEIRLNPEMEFRFDFADEMPIEGIYSEPYRPKVHFTAKKGWLNDPNGLFYANGTYHLFFQHNPAGESWGNMHWGHAVSTDLVHWTETDIGLKPDEFGTMFSGSAFVDLKNVSGLKENENNVILLFYTAAGNTSKLSSGKKFTQCMAYSTDNGKTFKKYSKNPVVPHIMSENRDPKVIYSKELEKYIMAIYLDGNDYMLLTSDNLTEWTQFQKIKLENDGECPDIYPLKVDNFDGEYKWVMLGASDNYIVGNFENNRFVVEQSSRPYRVGAKTSYAAQTYDNTGDRRIKIAWEMVRCPFESFNSQMGIPCEISLSKIGNEYYLRSLPVSEFETLRGKESKAADISVNMLNPFKISPLDKNAYEVIISAERKDTDYFEVSMLGINIKIDTRSNKISLLNQTIPLSYNFDRDNISVRFIIDSCGIELFADNGLIYTADNFIADYNLNTLSITSGSYAKINSVSAYSLNNIWENN